MWIVERRESEMSKKSISRVAYIQGELDLEDLARLVTAGIDAITPGQTFEYFPETGEGEEFSWKLTQMLREHPSPGVTFVDADRVACDSAPTQWLG